MSDLTDWLDKAVIESESKYFTFRRGLELNNGVTLSIQASEGAYSTPRLNGLNSADYSAFEVGYPSEEIELLTPYAEEPNEPTNTVYPYTPISVIEQAVEQAGGVKGLRAIKIPS